MNARNAHQIYRSTLTQHDAEASKTVTEGLVFVQQECTALDQLYSLEMIFDSHTLSEVATAVAGNHLPDRSGLCLSSCRNGAWACLGYGGQRISSRGQTVAQTHCVCYHCRELHTS